MSQNIFVFFQTLIIDFLQLIVIWVRNIKKIHIYTMKFKVHGHSYQKMLFIFCPTFSIFTKIIIKNVPQKYLSKFVSAVLEKFVVNTVFSFCKMAGQQSIMLLALEFEGQGVQIAHKFLTCFHCRIILSLGC